MPLSAEDQYFGETNQSTSNVEDEYFGETKSAEDEYFGPETAGSQKYSKEQEKQLTESIYLEEALNEARRGMVPVKNAISPNESSDADRKQDQMMTGDVPDVTEYNQYMNNMEKEERNLFNIDNLGGPLSKKLENVRAYAKKKDLDTAMTGLDQMKNIPTNFRRGAASAYRSMPGAAGMAAEYYAARNRNGKWTGLTGQEFKGASDVRESLAYGLKRWGQEKRIKNRIYMEGRTDLDITDDSTISKFAHGLGGGAVSIIEAGALYAINPATVMIAFGSQAAGQTYVNAKQQGLTDKDAINYATIDGVLEGGLEALGTHLVFKKSAVNALVKFAEGFLGEGLTEGAQEVKGNIIRKYGLNMEQGVFDNALMSIAIGGFLGGGPGSIDFIKSKLTDKGVPPEAVNEMVQLSQSVVVDLKKKGYTSKEIESFNNEITREQLQQELSEDKITVKLGEGKAQETAVPKRGEETRSPETPKQPMFQANEGVTSKKLVEVAKVNKLAKNYGINLNNVKGVYKIVMPNGKKASGAYADGIVYISDSVTNTTGSHEAFHWFKEQFADNNLYDKAKAEVIKNTELRDETEVEEYLAEEFGKYRSGKIKRGPFKQLFNNIMGSLKKIFGKDKNTRKLWKEFESGKSQFKNKKQISKAKYQDMDNSSKKKYENSLLRMRKQALTAELGRMKREIASAVAGERGAIRTLAGDAVGGYGTKSTFPEWFTKLGLKDRKTAMRAFDRTNPKYYAMLQEADTRLQEGFSDKKTMEQTMPDEGYVDLIESMKETNSDRLNKVIEKESQINKRAKDAKHRLRTRKLVRKTKASVTVAMDKKAKTASKAYEQKLAAKDKLIKTLRDKAITLKKFKTEAINYAKKLPLRQRGKLLAKIKNMNSLLDRARTISYIDKLFNASERSALKKSIVKELKNTKVKKQAGKPVGKFTPEIQRVMDKMRVAAKLTRGQAADKIQNNIELYDQGKFPAEIAFENKILNMVGGIDGLETAQLRETLQVIKEMKSSGKLVNQLKKSLRQTALAEIVSDVVEVVTGGKGMPSDYSIKSIKQYAPKTLRQKTNHALRGLGMNQVGWKDILDMISSLDKGSIPGESMINQWADVLAEKNAEKAGQIKYIKEIRDMFYDSFNLKSDKQMTKKIQEDIAQKELGRFTLADGRKVTLEMSVSEARKRYMEFKDNSLDSSFESMGYTTEIRNAINGMLSDQDVDFAERQLAFYQEYYKSINEVYSDIYGVDLPMIEFYSPIRREGIARDEGLGASEFLQDLHLKQGVANGSIKSRTANLKKILQQGDLVVLEKHVVEMEHFKAWAYKVRDLKSVFGTPEVRDAIKINHRQGFVSTIDNFISDFASGGAQMSGRMNLLDNLRANFAKSTLAVKASIGVKQLTSFVAYADAIPVGAWSKNAALFWANPIKNTKQLYKMSTLLKARGKNMERDIALAMKQDSYKSFRKSKSFTDLLLLNVQLGDQAAIVMGGWPVYKYYIDKGYSPSEAINKFESVTESTQQSADISELSTWQRGSSFGKLFTMFKSSPNQYLRKEIGAIRNLLAGRGSVAQHAKTIVIYHFVLPTLFQFVSNGLKWDDDEQKRAVLLGGFNGIFLFGDGLDLILRKATGLHTFGMNPIPMMSVYNDVAKAIGRVSKDDISSEDVLKAVRDLSSAVGGATGAPLKQVVDFTAGINDLHDGEYDKGMYKLLGWSPYIAAEATTDTGSGRSSRSNSSRSTRSSRRSSRSRR